MQAVWTTIFILTCDKLQAMMHAKLIHFAVDFFVQDFFRILYLFVHSLFHLQVVPCLPNASLHKVSIMVDKHRSSITEQLLQSQCVILLILLTDSWNNRLGNGLYSLLI